MKTLEEIRNSGDYYKHHTESRCGFISRKKGGEKVKPYVGIFGKGFIIVSPRWDTTQYVNMSYWIERKGENND